MQKNSSDPVEQGSTFGDFRLSDDEAVKMNLLVERARSEADVDERLFAEVERIRESPEYRRPYEVEYPLVSVFICTHNRAGLLVDRCLASVLEQDYPNLEVLVVGDGCSDETEERLSRIGDPRLVFRNLPRGRYPEHRVLRWMVAGIPPANYALSVVKGDLITQLDDDDEYLAGRIRKLVSFLKETRAELVWHPFLFQGTDGTWEDWPAETFSMGRVTNGSVLYHSWLRRIPYDPKAYRYLEPGDWNRFRKFSYLGVRTHRYPEALLRHYTEGGQAR